MFHFLGFSKISISWTFEVYKRDIAFKVLFLFWCDSKVHFRFSERRDFWNFSCRVRECQNIRVWIWTAIVHQCKFIGPATVEIGPPNQHRLAIAETHHSPLSAFLLWASALCLSLAPSLPDVENRSPIFW